MAEAQTVVLRGKTSFASVLPGDLVTNYNKDGKEWKLDLEIDEATAKTMKQYGIADRVKRKDNYLDGAPYLSFKIKELNNKGEPNEPLKITDILGNSWGSEKIGNKSVVDLKFVVMDYGRGKPKGVYPRSMRVLEHVPYKPKDFADIDEDDPYYKAALEAAERRKATEVDLNTAFGLNQPKVSTTVFDDDLDDDIPFA